MSEMRNPESRSTAFRRSRRNLIKMAAVAGSVVVAKMEPASANCGHNGKDVGNGCSGVSCFLRGTTIRTSQGDRKVEDLAAGDLLPTVFGGTRPIQWIGRYRFEKTDPTKAWERDITPVRIARSALGPDVPHADLFVTRTHALLIDDVLVPVSNLINGTTITLCDARACDELEFFHIKLDRHDVIHAEGAPCETLLNVDERATNFADYARDYGAPSSGNAPCVPVLGFGDRVEIMSRFRSAFSPWIDRRQKLDIIRDKLEEGEITLSRQPELLS
jgi:hypothetical protein